MAKRLLERAILVLVAAIAYVAATRRDPYPASASHAPPADETPSATHGETDGPTDAASPPAHKPSATGDGKACGLTDAEHITKLAALIALAAYVA